jgi:Ca2+-binding EF-hand superfamily protein
MRVAKSTWVAALGAAVVLLLPAPVQSAGVEVPFELARLIERSPQRAVESLGRTMAQISSDGTVSEMTIRRREMVEESMLRARTLAKLLALDLDNDGQIIDIEVTATFEASDTRDRREILVITTSADQDHNGIITFEEMRLQAAESLNDKRRNKSRYNDAYQILALDLDGNGEVTMREMVEAVERFSAKCSCVE